MQECRRCGKTALDNMIFNKSMVESQQGNEEKE